MNMNRNIIPEKVDTIHLIAVCGTGMGALAAMLKELGFSVSGSDQNVYPPMSDFLADKGIPVSGGLPRRKSGPPSGPGRGGQRRLGTIPRRWRCSAAGLCFCSMPQALNHFVAGGKKQIVGHRHPRQDHHLGPGGLGAGQRRTGSVLHDRGHSQQFRQQLPPGSREAHRHRRGRIRHGLFRQGPQISSLPAACGRI